MIEVVMTVYACRPNAGSEEGMGWNWVKNLGRHCRLHVINEGEWKEEVEAALAQLEYRDNITMYYLPVSEKVREMCWNQGNWLFYLHYRRWHIRAYRKALEIIDQHPVDLVHQLNFISFREPGFLWKIKSLPFVWGPVGGMENMPVPYIKGESWKHKLFVLLKNTLNTLQVKFQPRVRRAMNHAAVVIASGKGIETIVRREFGREPVTINETGCYPADTPDVSVSANPADAVGISVSASPADLPESSAPASPASSHPIETTSGDFNILWVGKFDYRKQLGLALRTIAALKHLPGIRFHVAGTGSDADVARFHQLSDDLGLHDITRWHGRMSNPQVHQLMHQSQLLFFTSIMDATSTVVVEAIMNKLPVVCFNICGFGPIVDKSVGRTIDLSDPTNSVTEFKREIENLYRNRTILSQLSAQCALKSKGELAWPVKAQKMKELYEDVLTEKAE